jgi:predicted nuclease of predicted toxin-antitoxin system
MRFLADAAIAPATVEFLRQAGHDAIHVRQLQMQRAPDTAVVEYARAERRVVLTFDLDFGEVLALGIHDRPSVVILRLTDQTADSVNERLSIVLARRRR